MSRGRYWRLFSDLTRLFLNLGGKFHLAFFHEFSAVLLLILRHDVVLELLLDPGVGLRVLDLVVAVQLLVMLGRWHHHGTSNIVVIGEFPVGRNIGCSARSDVGRLITTFIIVLVLQKPVVVLVVVNFVFEMERYILLR